MYCIRCGAKNDDDARYCVKCGANLQITQKRSYRSDDECFGLREWEGACFGFRHGGAIIGVVFGLLIIAAGISAIFGEPIWQWLLPLFVLAIGLMIIVSVLFRGWRR